MPKNKIRFSLPVWALLCCLHATAGQGEKMWPLPDSVRAQSCVVELGMPANGAQRFRSAGLLVNGVSVSFVQDKKGSRYVFSPMGEATVITMGTGVLQGKKNTLSLPASGSGLVMVSMASDSAEGFTLYSAYLQHAGGPWKLIGCFKKNVYAANLKTPGIMWASTRSKDSAQPEVKQLWAQRPNGSWKNLLDRPATPPTVNLMRNADSATRAALEKGMIEAGLKQKYREAFLEKEGVFYRMERAGNGRQVMLSDTVKVFYKGYLFENNATFDETTGETRSFPLARLIRGWQIAVPLLREGGRLQVIIPSHLGYGIRTRSPKIPPNSILVFEIEVVETIAARK